MKASKEFNKVMNVNGALLSQDLIDKIKELQKSSGVTDILQEIDDITCDLSDISLNDPDATASKYLAIILALRSYRQLFALLIAA